MSDVNTGGGGAVGGNVGAGQDFTGRDSALQSVRISLSDIDKSDLQRIIEIVLGDGRRWRGVAGELDKLDQSLTAKMHTMEHRLEGKMEELERRVTDRPAVDFDNKILLAILLGVAMSTVLLAWIAWMIVAGGGWRVVGGV